MAKFTKRFTEWQNYVHYILLALAILLLTHLLGIHYFHQSITNFIYLLIYIFIADTIIHFLFWIAPKKLRWRD